MERIWSFYLQDANSIFARRTIYFLPKGVDIPIMITYNSFWFQSVLDLFADSDKPFICCSSVAFKHAWRNERFCAKLKEFAQLWIEEPNNIVAKVGSDDSEVIFYAITKDRIKWREVMRQTRIDFLKWLIEKKVEISL